MTPTSDAQSPLERWLLGLRPVRAVIANAFRIEDRVRLVRVKLVRKRGYLTVLEPYTGYGSTTWVRALARVHMAPPGNRRRFSLSRLLRRKHRESVVRGWRSFARVSAGNVPATVIIDGVRHPVKADRGGIVDINLPANLAPGWNTITFESFDRQTSEAPVFIVADDQRVGLLSDIDDTVMVTALPRPMLAAWNTFVLDVHARTPTPGMSVLAERILTTFGRSDTPVVYLSTGPWNVAPTLARFLGRNLYPAGPLLLTDWGPTPERIFRSGLEHKVSNLDRLAREFPDIKWILVGDDGQHDEQIYGEFTSRHPDRVLAIAIRQLSTSEAVLAGGRAASAHWRKNAPVPWVYAPDGAGLAKQLTEGGIIPDLSQAPEKAPDETR